MKVFTNSIAARGSRVTSPARGAGAALSLISSANEAVAAAAQPAGRVAGIDRVRRRGLIGLYLELSKARLSALVLFTTAVGYALGSTSGGRPGAGFAWLTFLWTMAGTALAAASANALNQLAEVRRDALMVRTRNRPLPSGAMAPAHALAFALAAAAAGLIVLWTLVNPAAAGLALATILIYLLLYTPLKPRSPLNTLVGAVCGAIPPLIGWVAAAGRLDAAASVLAGLLFVWQLPHFFALAWLYREDYARGGFAMLPVVDPDGRLTGRLVVGASAVLVAVSLAATVLGMTGWIYAAGASVLGAWLVALGARLLARRSDASARRLFLATIVYLPILLCLMVVDRA